MRLPVPFGFYNKVRLRGLMKIPGIAEIAVKTIIWLAAVLVFSTLVGVVLGLISGLLFRSVV
jgi:hypothetical protein